MGYFSNGTEHLIYLETTCFHCQNYRDLGDGRGPGCPILDLHFLWNYDALKEGGEDKQYALDHFIPREADEDGNMIWNGECTMFLPRHDEEGE